MRTLLPCLLLAACAACIALHPRLPPEYPPPNLPRGVVVLDLSPDQADALQDLDVVEDREGRIEELALADPAFAAHVLEHRVVTGMRVREVLWAMTGHPTRQRALGPPGGRFLLFEPGRFFVRLGAMGTVVDGGRF